MIDHTAEPSRPADPSRPAAFRPATDRALAARLLASLRDGNDVRSAKVRRVRRACAEERYENDLKLAVAADRVLEVIGARASRAPAPRAARGGIASRGIEPLAASQRGTRGR